VTVAGVNVNPEYVIVQVVQKAAVPNETRKSEIINFFILYNFITLIMRSCFFRNQSYIKRKPRANLFYYTRLSALPAGVK
jgi:hypothetical protein